MSTRSILCASLLSALLLSCASGGGANSTAGGSAEPVREGSRQRLILFQPDMRGGRGTLFIVVNESHPRRDSVAGRTQIALGDSSQSYKVVSDQSFGNTVASLRNYGFFARATPMRRGDEIYLSDAARQDPRFRGCVFYQDGETRLKIVGFRPGGRQDVDGQKDFQAFRDAKTIVMQAWNANPRSEQPLWSSR